MRRLSAILAADVVGYSRLMGEDESGTLAALRTHRAEIFDPVIAERGGRLVKLMGDGALVEFSSVVDAVEAALAIQQRVAEGGGLIRLRIGVNLGDIIIDGDDIYGDGVNVAARLEALAEPGGICIASIVQESIGNRVETEFTDAGDHEVKGIARPIRVWRWPATGATQATLALPEKPSIAILPFDNMSGDPEQEFFADGMAEDIITGLSRFRSLFVIARNSSFGYKGKSPDVREVARELGVLYILEGSIRRSGARIRVSAQLIDAVTGNHLWAERYDRNMEDIFVVQDEVTEAIVAAIAPEIGEEERARAQRTPPGSLNAWGLYQHGLAAYYSSTVEGLRSAIEQFDGVNEVDPTFAPAFAMAAGARWRYALHFQPEDSATILNHALRKAYTAITLDPRDATGLYHAGQIHSMSGQHDMALSKLKEAVGLNPADVLARYFLGGVLRRAGRAEEAIPHFDMAMRLSPRDMFFTGMLTDRAFVLFDLERYEEALDWAQRARLSPNPRTMTFAIFAAVLVKLGRLDEGRVAVNDLLAHAPGLTYTKYRANLFGTSEVMERLASALREAGLPD